MTTNLNTVLITGASSVYLDAIIDSIERHNSKVMHFAGDAVLADFATVSGN